MIVYRLSSENHLRITKLALWLHVGPDILLKKLVETELDLCEEVLSQAELMEDLQEKYNLAARLNLLED